jgi:metal-responsive CopG/Arc/MetJ family transcriptional regulator
MSAFTFNMPQMFRSKTERKVSVKLPDDMVKAIDQLSETMGFDRSKCMRWCFEQVLKEAIEQKVIPGPERAAG